jgi:hypothetical protein
MTRSDRSQEGEEIRVPGRNKSTGSPNRVDTVESAQRGSEEGGGFCQGDGSKFGFLQVDDARFSGQKGRTHNVTFIRITEATDVPGANHKIKTTIHL